MMYCCICFNGHSVLTPAAVIHDGYSLCWGHQRDILSEADYVRFCTDGRFNLEATIAAMPSGLV